MNSNKAGVVILAAGRSERMKELKAFLPFDDDFSFIGQIIQTYSVWGCHEIVVVTNTEATERMKQTENVHSSVKVVVNDHLEFERFYSVKLGLGEIHKSSFCFIQNVDNPFIDSQILDLLYDNRSKDKYISPVFENKGGHPVLLNRENINQITTWNENSATFKDVLNTMECMNVEMPDHRVLININSREEYHKYFINS
jgi:molybdenum cofactor cytidylyltransferase